LESFVFLSDVVQVWSTTTQLLGAGVGVIHAGFTYNIWGIGALDHQQTLNVGQTYYLIQGSQIPELAWYQGETTLGNLWIETPGGNVYNLSIRFDSSGIFFTPINQMSNLPIGTVLKFTQALILVDPGVNP